MDPDARTWNMQTQEQIIEELARKPEVAEWFVSWDRRGGQSYPRNAFPGPCLDSALNPIYGDCTGPYTRAEAERIVRDDEPC